MEINENFRAIYRFSTVNFEKEKAVTYNRKVKIQRIPWENKELLVFHVLCLHYQWDSPHTAFEIEKAISLFNNLIVLVNNNGTIVNIYGYKKVQKQWQKIKQEILKDHKGEEVDSYIEHIEATVSDKALFVDFLGSNQMYGLFFNGQWQSLKDFYQGNAENALKIIQTEPFQKYIYRGTQIQEIQKELSNTKYKLLCLGTIL